MTNRPANLFKRIIAACIDFLCVFTIFYFVTFAVKSSDMFYETFKIEEKYTAINEVFCPSIVEKGLGVYTHEEGKAMTCKLYTSKEYIDNNIEEVKANNPGKTDEEIFNIIKSQYDEKASKHDEMIMKNEIYLKNYSALVNIDNGVFYVSTFIGEIIFLLIIPFIRKDNKTLGKCLMKLKLITTKDLEIEKKHILYNFIGLYGVETVLYSLFLGIDSLIVFVPLISIMVILFSPRKQNVHHMFSRTLIVEEQGCVSFKTIEEKNKYDATLARRAKERGR